MRSFIGVNVILSQKWAKIANDQYLELNGEPQISLNDLKFVVHVLISIYCPPVSITKTIGLEKNFSRRIVLVFDTRGQYIVIRTSTTNIRLFKLI